MKKCSNPDIIKQINNKDDPDSKNGLITKIWGPPGWEFFHSVTFGYPIEPTEQQKIDYMEYFTIIGKVFPCVYCRDSYQQFIKEGDTALNMDIMSSRDTLTRWGWRLHNRVNQKLDTDYGVSYEEMARKYESYRARCTKTGKGCLAPLDIKAKSYQNAAIQRAPIIDIKYALDLIPHARTLGLHGYKYQIKKTQSILDTDRYCEDWLNRESKCRSIISYMRKHGIPSLDENQLPTVHEMMLISMLSSTLEKKQLADVVEKVCQNN